MLSEVLKSASFSPPEEGQDAPRAGAQSHQPSERKLVLIYNSSLGNLKHDMPVSHAALRGWQFVATTGFFDTRPRSLNLNPRLC
jgi:hypothetical protein